MVAVHPCRIVPLLVKIVLEYCQCADDLPNLVSEVMSKLIEVLKVLLYESLSFFSSQLPYRSHFPLLPVLQWSNMYAGAGSGSSGDGRTEDYHCQTSRYVVFKQDILQGGKLVAK